MINNPPCPWRKHVLWGFCLCILHLVICTLPQAICSVIGTVMRFENCHHFLILTSQRIKGMCRHNLIWTWINPRHSRFLKKCIPDLDNRVPIFNSICVHFQNFIVRISYFTIFKNYAVTFVIMFAHDTLIWISVSKYLESLFLALIEFMKFPYAP